MELSRRAILSGLIAAPAVVAVGNIMPVRLWDPLIWVGQNPTSWEYTAVLSGDFAGREIVQLKESEFLTLLTGQRNGEWGCYGAEYLLGKPRRRWDSLEGTYKAESEPRISIYMQRDNSAPAHPCTIHTEEVVFAPYELRQWTS